MIDISRFEATLDLERDILLSGKFDKLSDIISEKEQMIDAARHMTQYRLLDRHLHPTRNMSRFPGMADRFVYLGRPNHLDLEDQLTVPEKFVVKFRCQKTHRHSRFHQLLPRTYCPQVIRLFAVIQVQRCQKTVSAHRYHHIFRFQFRWAHRQRQR